jgi:hypothetical protein
LRKPSSMSPTTGVLATPHRNIRLNEPNKKGDPI